MEGEALRADADHPLATTAHLLQRVRAGDAVARDEVLLRYRVPLARFLHDRLNPAARGVVDTDDVVQDVLLAALQRLESFEYRGLGSFWGYLRRIGINRMMAQGRNGLPAESPAESSAFGPASTTEPPADLVRREALTALEDAIERVEEQTRGALLLRLELDLPYAVIARECGYPTADAARMAIARCMASLARELAAFQP